MGMVEIRPRNSKSFGGPDVVYHAEVVHAWGLQNQTTMNEM